MWPLVLMWQNTGKRGQLLHICGGDLNLSLEKIKGRWWRRKGGLERVLGKREGRLSEAQIHCWAEAVCLWLGPQGIAHRTMVLRPSITHAHTHLNTHTHTHTPSSSTLTCSVEPIEASTCTSRDSSYHSQFSVFPSILLAQLRHNHNINTNFFLINSTVDHTACSQGNTRD